MKKIILGLILGMLVLGLLIAGDLIQKDIGLDSKLDYTKAGMINIKVSDLTCGTTLCNFKITGDKVNSEQTIQRNKQVCIYSDKPYDYEKKKGETEPSCSYVEKTKAELDAEVVLITKNLIEGYMKVRASPASTTKVSDGFAVK